MILGINADPVHGFSGSELARLGVKFVRFPLVHGQEYRAAINDYAAHGMYSVPIIVRQCFPPDFPASPPSFGPAIQRWLDIYPDVHQWCIGNEPDQPASASSWAQTPAQFQQLLKDARTVMGPDRVLYAGGMVSGRPDYLEGVDLTPADFLDIHPYGQRPRATFPAPDWGFNLVDNLLALYRRFGRPLVCMEFGGEGNLFTGEPQRAQYYAEMVKALVRLGVSDAAAFCYSDLMFPDRGGMGLVDDHGLQKASFGSFVGAANV